MVEENCAETWLNSIIMDIFKHEKEPINCKILNFNLVIEKKLKIDNEVNSEQILFICHN